MTINRHIYRTTSYDRKKGVLTKDDYLYMRDLLETVLQQTIGSSHRSAARVDFGITYIMFIRILGIVNDNFTDSRCRAVATTEVAQATVLDMLFNIIVTLCDIR